MGKSIGGDRYDGCYGKNYNLLNVETQLELFEQYTTAMEKKLEEEDNLENNPSRPSHEQGLSTDSDESQVNNKTPDEPSLTVTNAITNDDELKVGDRVRYVGKKNSDYSKDEIMEVVKIAVHWSGNQVTCNYSRGWTTWISEGYWKKINSEQDHD